jgi:hypothetical protein
MNDGAHNENLTGVTALLRIAACAFPTAGLFGFFLVCTGVWQRFDPAQLPRARGVVERTILRAQIERAATIPRRVDVLSIGDSAGLMGIDPLLLGDLLGGERVEILNTIALVGPHGHARMLERFLDSGGQAGRVLLTMDGFSLQMMASWRGWEKMALDGVLDASPPAALLPGVRARLLSVVGPVLYVPVPGAFGDVYGSVEGLGRFVRAHRGGAIEPNSRASVGPEALSVGLYKTNERFMEALEALAKVVERLGPERLRLVFMPHPQFYASEEVSRRRRETERLMSRRLGLDVSRRLDVPAALPDRWFGTQTHLNRRGRRRFTHALAQALSADPARRPGGRGYASVPSAVGFDSPPPPSSLVPRRRYCEKISGVMRSFDTLW